MSRRLNRFQILLPDLHPRCISFSFIFKISKNKSCFQHLIFLQPSSTHCLNSQVCVLVTQLCPTLCDSLDCSQPGSSVHGILQTRTLEWVPFPSPRDPPDPEIKSMSLASPALTKSQTWLSDWTTTNLVFTLICKRRQLSANVWIHY